MAERTLDDLRQKQALPLPVKIRLTQERIRQWVNEFGEDGVYVAYSGGKDSTVLLHLVRQMYPDVKAVFCDTGLEYPSVRQFVSETENVEILKPKMNFKQIIIKYGYPIISKEVASAVDIGKKYINKLIEHKQKGTDAEMPYLSGIADLLGIPRRLADKEGEYYKLLKKGIIPDEVIADAPHRVKMLYGKVPHKEKGVLTNEFSKMYDKSKWKFLLDAPFRLSDQCCRQMKKLPAHRYQVSTGKKPMTGQMADESRLRRSQWLLHGCNMFDVNYPISNPIAFWTEQDVLKYAHDYNISIADPYGKIIVKNDTGIDGQMSLAEMLGDYSNCQYDTEKANRTGCIFCLFGIAQDKQRLARLSEEEPKLYDYVMRGGEFVNDVWQPNTSGLGYWFIIKWLNIFGNLGIPAPGIDEYEHKYGNERTEEELRKEEEDERERITRTDSAARG